MTQHQLLHGIQIWSAHATFWSALGFCLLVNLFWPWWLTDFGWSIFLKTLCLGLVLLPFELQSIFHVNPNDLWFLWLFALAFAAIPVIIVWRFIVILIIQRYEPPPTKSGRRVLSAHERWKSRRNQKNVQEMASDTDITEH